MKFIYVEYNMYHNSIDITTFDGYLLRIDCNKAEDGLKTNSAYYIYEIYQWKCINVPMFVFRHKQK